MFLEHAITAGTQSMLMLSYYFKYILTIVVFISMGYFLNTYEVLYVPIDNEQMDPQIPADSRLWLEQKEREPGTQVIHGDVVHFVHRHRKFDERSEIYLGRVVALEGERVALRNRRLYRASNSSGTLREVSGEDPGRWLFSKPESKEEHAPNPAEDFLDYVVPKDHVFVLLDQRDSFRKRRSMPHYDSRFFGPIHRSLILGRVAR
jgi:signal peptidase I